MSNAGPYRPSDAEALGRMASLLTEVLLYARHHHTCGECHGSDCGSYHAPFCRLDGIKRDAAALFAELERPTGDEVCEWCGRAIFEENGLWLAVKGHERGYDPLTCDAVEDRETPRHEPTPRGSAS